MRIRAYTSSDHGTIARVWLDGSPVSCAVDWPIGWITLRSAFGQSWMEVMLDGRLVVDFCACPPDAAAAPGALCPTHQATPIGEANPFALATDPAPRGAAPTAASPRLLGDDSWTVGVDAAADKERAAPAPRPCTCHMNDLLRFGCRCGGFESERAARRAR